MCSMHRDRETVCSDMMGSIDDHSLPFSKYGFLKSNKWDIFDHNTLKMNLGMSLSFGLLKCLADCLFWRYWDNILLRFQPDHFVLLKSDHNEKKQQVPSVSKLIDRWTVHLLMYMFSYSILKFCLGLQLLDTKQYIHLWEIGWAEGSWGYKGTSVGWQWISKQFFSAGLWSIINYTQT